MIMFLRKLGLAWTISRCRGRVVDAIFRNDAERAAFVLNKMESLCELSPRDLILKGLILYKINRLEDSLRVLNMVDKDIAADKYFNNDERQYLLLYRDLVRSDILTRKGAYRSGIIKRAFDIKSVRKHIREYFPIVENGDDK